MCSSSLQAKNYLPSISASVGNFTPQKYIWRLCVGLTCAPRFMFAIMHYNMYKSYPLQKCRWTFDFVNRVACWLHIAEVLCLVLLTFVSSSENYRKCNSI